MSRSNIHVRIDSKVKKEFQELCEKHKFEMGLVFEVFAERWVAQESVYRRKIIRYDKARSESRVGKAKRGRPRKVCGES
jgi:hypothetical protein